MSVPFGKNIKLYINGTSHGEFISMSLFGLPAGIKVPRDELSAFLKRRQPSQNWETPRTEPDLPVFTSGVTNGITDGKEIKAVIYNKNVSENDYADIKRYPRPSHADFPALIKYGQNVDLNGGGHFSGRLTALTCVAGFIALQYLKQSGTEVFAHVYSIKDIFDTPFDAVLPQKCSNPFPVINSAAGEKMQLEAEKARLNGDTLGGIIECAVTNLPIGLGEHMFNSVEATITDALFSVPSVKCVEFGAGFNGTKMYGSEYNDAFYYDRNTVKTKTNNCGGILGGLTNGMPLIFRAGLKPVPSIAKEQDTVDLLEGKNAKIKLGGRHDSCIVPRAVPVIEAAAALAIADLMYEKTDKTNLEALRTEIDKTDKIIVNALCERMDLCRKVAIEKQKTGKAVFDPEREKTLLKNISELSGDNSAITSKIYDVILDYSKKLQNETVNGDKND